MHNPNDYDGGCSVMIYRDPSTGIIQIPPQDVVSWDRVVEGSIGAKLSERLDAPVGWGLWQEIWEVTNDDGSISLYFRALPTSD